MTAVADAIATVDRGLDAMERGDVDALAVVVEAGCRPDFEFESAIDAALGGASFRGASGMRRWFAGLFETVDELRWRDRRYEAVGEHGLLVLAHFEMRGRASGAPTETEIGQVFEFDERGLLASGRSYASHAEARQAAQELRERPDIRA